MRSELIQVEVRTGGRIRAHDVTEHVRSAVRAAGVRQGLVVVSVPHTTCAVCVNENETGLCADIERLAREVLEPLARQGEFAHDRIDGNTRAHLTSILFGHQATLSIVDGEVVLGTWQSVFLVELDGPRRRSLHVQVLGV